MKNHIRFYREIAGLSQAKLGYAVGVTQQAVDKYERGLMNPSLATIIRLSEFFEVPVSALFEMD